MGRNVGEELTIIFELPCVSCRASCNSYRSLCILLCSTVVWAQVPGSPWWPAMVDIDPDYKRYDWFNSAGTVVVSVRSSV